MTWTNDQTEALADRHFRSQSVRCPSCSGPVEVHEQAILGRTTTDLTMNCRRCGDHGRYSGQHLGEMDLSWTLAEMKSIIDSYWDHGWARCPNDDTRLNVHESHALGRKEPTLSIRCKRCGRHLSSGSLPEEPDPSSFDFRFETLEKIGEGGMGEVFLIQDRKLGKQLVSKRIRSAFFNDPDLVRRFKREIRLLCSISHENVVAVHDYFLDENGGNLVMEYMEGGNLQEAINDPATSNDQLSSMFHDLVIGLAHVHDKGIIHRDLKPSNVLIDGNGRARIADFGLAVLLERDTTPLTRAGQGLGTPHYAAPEQENDAAAVGKEADLYALGLIAYEVATRRSPYRQPIRTLDGTLGDLIASALEEDPQDRRTSGAEISVALSNHLEDC